LAKGIDNTPVQTEQEAKSFGEETTLEKDTQDLNILKNYLLEFATAIGNRLKNNGMSCRTITVKIKYYNFKNITRSITLSKPTYSSMCIYEHAVQILKQRINLSIPVRLIGLQVSNLIYPDEPMQISIDGWLKSIYEMKN